MQTSRKSTQIISINGTKGKTTTTRLLDHVFRKLGVYTLRVDSDGHYLNGRQKSTDKESRILRSAAPTVAPGAYLYELYNKKNAVAVLENSIGSHGNSGLGYRIHQVGVFMNVYEDHLNKKIRSRKDIAKRKGKLAFSALDYNGYAVFNADDPLVVGELHQVPADKDISLIPFGISFKHFDLETHLKHGGVAITYENPHIVFKSKDTTTKLFDAHSVPWAFDGLFTPSLYNLMAACAALIGYFDGKKLNRKTIQHIVSFRQAAAGGRLMLLENKRRDIRVLIDYAHEKYSILEVSKLARSLSRNKTVGVVRFAPDRTNEQLKDYARAIANAFDFMVIYDKVDGLSKKPHSNKKYRYYRDVGEVSKIVYDTIVATRGSSERVFRKVEEEKAIALALKHSEAGDVVVHISNEHKRSLGYVKKHLASKKYGPQQKRSQTKTIS